MQHDGQEPKRLVNSRGYCSILHFGNASLSFLTRALAPWVWVATTSGANYYSSVLAKL